MTPRDQIVIAAFLLFFSAGVLILFPIVCAADVLLLPFMVLVRGPLFGCSRTVAYVVRLTISRLRDDDGEDHDA